MALDEGDKAIIAEIAGAIIEKVLKTHVDTCPHGITLRIKKAQLVAFIMGVIVVSGASSGGIIIAVIKIFGMG